MQDWQHSSDALRTTQVTTIIPPCCDDNARICCRVQEPFVICFTDGVFGSHHNRRIRCTVSKKIRHSQATITPGPCKDDASLNSGIVVGFIGGRRVQPGEHCVTLRFIPEAPKCESIPSAARQNGIRLHGRLRAYLLFLGLLIQSLLRIGPAS